MRFYRFYLEEEISQKEEIFLGKEERNKIKNVLRLNPEDKIILYDKNGEEFLGEIVSFGKENVRCKILKFLRKIEEVKLKITLAQSLLRKEKIETVISKTTEIGVDKIFLFESKRSVGKISLEEKENKLERYLKIAKHSSEQAKRGIVPEICFCSFKNIIAQADKYSISFLFHQDSKNNLKNFLIKNRDVKNILIIIGPEGGFTEEEIKEAEKYNINIVSLGKRILKSETSAIVAISIILYEYGEI
jgi:16S rRNA (uracil1498-N3)-methyltransferase